MTEEFEEDVTTRVPASQRGLRVSSAELVVVDGPERGRRAAFVGGRAKIGTSEGMTLRLSDPTVSRVHCELEVKSGRITLRDAGSTNGTWVHGVSVREGELDGGVVLGVGQTTVRVELGSVMELVPISERTELGELRGASVEMRQVYAILERAAQSDVTVLVTGETGTGKDVAARSLHAISRRAKGPFVPIDCGAIPEHLIESELFGHVKGAFSGATGDRVGVFEEASGGTLFLDEIGEMPLALQPKLLRALETRTVRPVGSNTPRPIDVRIVAATNRPLARCVNEGSFREDLYYRLAVVEVSLPPLRQRREDVATLARHFHERLAPGAKPLTADFLASLSARSWPGNVRELRNHLERCVSLGVLDRDRSSSNDLAASPPADLASLVPLHLPLKDAKQVWIEEFESIYVRAMLDATGGNLTRAAERAGVSRRFLQRLLARHRQGSAPTGDD